MDGLDWTGWILLRRLVLLEHLTVLINPKSKSRLLDLGSDVGSVVGSDHFGHLGI